MVPSSFREHCVALRTQGYTLSEIVSVVRRPKSSVFFHIRHVPISRRLYHRLKLIKAKAAFLNRIPKGTSRSGIQLQPFTIWAPERVALVAHVMFDGAVSRSGVLYHSRQRVLLERFRNIMRPVYAGNPRRYENIDGTKRLAYHDVALVPYFQRKKSELLASVMKLDTECQRAFLKAFFDDEGSVHFRPRRWKRCVRGTQKNAATLLLIRRVLQRFNIISRIERSSHSVVITGRENLESFAREINFSAGVRMNGRRSNSVWSRNIEKKDILTKALRSYRD